MISWKICLVGAFAVGKTSLVKQFVYSIFSDQYLSTVGVKISKKELKIKDKKITMMIWDMEGKDSFTSINTTYLRGASGFFVVADSTRKETLDEALRLRTYVMECIGVIPSYLLINKTDLTELCEITEEDYKYLEEQNIPYIKTSAKSGAGVEEAFQKLANDLL